MELLVPNLNINLGRRLNKICMIVIRKTLGHQKKTFLVDKYSIWSMVNNLSRHIEGFNFYWEAISLGELIEKNALANDITKYTVENLINNINLVLGRITSDFTIDYFKH